MSLLEKLAELAETLGEETTAELSSLHTADLDLHTSKIASLEQQLAATAEELAASALTIQDLKARNYDLLMTPSVESEPDAETADELDEEEQAENTTIDDLFAK